MTNLPIDAARKEKWRLGRIKYGLTFVGHPLEQLDDELIDAMNYAEEAAKRGYPMAMVSAELYALCELVRAILASANRAGQE